MPDSWGIAFGRAAGRYVTFFGDDDAFHSGLLATIAPILKEAAVELICWRRCIYRHGASLGNGMSNVLGIPPFSGGQIRLKSSDELRSFFRLHYSDSVPKV